MKIGLTDTCKSCLHRIKMESGKGFAQYCDIHPSHRTRNGHLRIKTNQPSCDRYAVGQPQTKTPDNQLTLFD